MKSVTCSTCGEVRFEVSLLYALKETVRFNNYFRSLTQEDRENYYGNKKSNIKFYMYCFMGHSYKQFRKFKKGDCPDGVTQSPILKRRK